MKRTSWIVTPTHGPRPKGKPDECFYCHSLVGSEHAIDCVMRVRTVMLRASVDICVEVGENDSPSEIIEFIRSTDLNLGEHVDLWIRSYQKRQLHRSADLNTLPPGVALKYLGEATAADHAQLGVSSDENTPSWPGECGDSED